MDSEMKVSFCAISETTFISTLSIQLSESVFQETSGLDRVSGVLCIQLFQFSWRNLNKELEILSINLSKNRRPPS